MIRASIRHIFASRHLSHSHTIVLSTPTPFVLLSNFSNYADANMSPCSAPITRRKRLYLLRHGQAAHNPRAEAAKDNGCSHETFLQLMKEDDVLDAELTELGIQQARRLLDVNVASGAWVAEGRGTGTKENVIPVGLVASSPLSRTLQTAQEAIGGGEGANLSIVCVESLREINGWLINAKRRDKDDLQKRFPSWDLSSLTATDESWTEVLESEENCRERGYQSLLWASRRKEDGILMVAHGGLLRFTLADHPRVQARHITDDGTFDAKDRFGNCELRAYDMSWDEDRDKKDNQRPLVTLMELRRVNAP
mmetsp:Transcript_32145/g.63647  ORF Transcript_32145/g.63647 Transcript_32145/m.63647 type:complete len:309 (+) Transcript_32145:73-999(+)